MKWARMCPLNGWLPSVMFVNAEKSSNDRGGGEREKAYNANAMLDMDHFENRCLERFVPNLMPQKDWVKALLMKRN